MKVKGMDLEFINLRVVPNTVDSGKRILNTAKEYTNFKMAMSMVINVISYIISLTNISFCRG